MRVETNTTAISLQMSSTQKPLVFVTGASGLLGYAIVYHLLQAGYPVRGSARGKKVESLKRALSNYPQFEAVEIADIASGDYSEIFKGVGAIIHTAAPVIGRADKETAFRSAIDGSIHVLREAEKAGITKIVTTSSIVSFNLPVGPYAADDWNPITKEQAFESGDPVHVYFAQKKYADLAVIDFLKTRPHLDVTMICPPFVYGPVPPGFQELLQELNSVTLSSNAHVYGLLEGDKGQLPPVPGYVDIRDVVRAHILALNSIPQSAVSDGKLKRLAIVSPIENDWREALKYIAEERPHLKDRLISPKKVPVFEEHRLKGIDFGRLEEVLGLKKDEFKTWKETVLDAVDSFEKIEEGWKSRGLKV
ncbi:hypothetical protein D9758_005447 [Tetrapyrgos nigripes]|uniref:NAD-dependent epimerase/dehydratase domain-containing protein n=1 Tax=Tetrapyrgos nigripes TaxID=182062 RepID=A0A8H5LQ04_9AGAR|nr:hypothetical protein D9758_005447 [Tetrapyrgos nigripes]